MSRVRPLGPAVVALVLCLSAVAAIASAQGQRDTDRDRVSDAKERRANCDRRQRDTDRDRMPDWWEVRFGLDCRDRRDAKDDPDGDRRSNVREFRTYRRSNGRCRPRADGRCNPRRKPRRPPLVSSPDGSTGIAQTGMWLEDRFNLNDPDPNDINRRQPAPDGGWTTVAVPGSRICTPDDCLPDNRPGASFAAVAAQTLRWWGAGEGRCWNGDFATRRWWMPADPDNLTGRYSPCSGSLYQPEAPPWSRPVGIATARLDRDDSYDLVVADERKVYFATAPGSPRFAEILHVDDTSDESSRFGTGAFHDVAVGPLQHSRYDEGPGRPPARSHVLYTLSTSAHRTSHNGGPFGNFAQYDVVFGLERVPAAPTTDAARYGASTPWPGDRSGWDEKRQPIWFDWSVLSQSRNTPGQYTGTPAQLLALGQPCGGHLMTAPIEPLASHRLPHVLAWGRGGKPRLHFFADTSRDPEYRCDPSGKGEAQSWVRIADGTHMGGYYGATYAAAGAGTIATKDRILDLKVEDLNGDRYGDAVMTFLGIDPATGEPNGKVSYAVGLYAAGAKTVSDAFVYDTNNERDPINNVHWDFGASGPGFNPKLLDGVTAREAADVELVDVVGPRTSLGPDGIRDIVLGGDGGDHLTVIPGRSGGTFAAAREVETAVADIPQAQDGRENTLPKGTYRGPGRLDAITDTRGVARIFALSKDTSGSNLDQMEVFRATTVKQEKLDVDRDPEPFAGRIFPVGEDGQPVRSGTFRAATGQKVTFVLEAPEGASNARRVEWRFPDKAAATAVDYPELSGAPSGAHPRIEVAHRFTSDGDYAVKDAEGNFLGTIGATVTNVGGQESTGVLGTAIRVIPALDAPTIEELVQGDLTTESAGGAWPGGEPASRITARAGATGGWGNYGYTWRVTDESGNAEPLTVSGRDFSARLSRGTYVLTLAVNDSSGGADPERQTKTVTKRIIVADPIAVSLATVPDHAAPHAVADEPITLRGTAAGGLGPFAYAFDLDGSPAGNLDYETSSPGPDLVHTFPRSGSFPVALRVTGTSGAGVATRTIQVAPALTPDLKVASAGTGSPRPITFSAVDSAGGIPPYTYLWTVDGADAPETGAAITRSLSPGEHTVSVRVRDADGHVSRTAATITRSEFQPDVRVSATQQHPETGESVTLRVTPPTTGTPPYRYRWELGSGQSSDADTGSATRTVTFARSGVHRVGVRVTDSDSSPATAEGHVVLEVVDPLRARPVRNPEYPQPGQSVLLDAGAEGGFGARSFAWDFDGGSAFPVSTDGTSSIRRTFAKGVHDVAVRVRDSADHTATARIRLPVAEPLVPALDLPRRRPARGEPVTLDGSRSRGGLGTLEYQFEIDGITLDWSRDATYTRPFDTAGKHEIRLRVRDEGGVASPWVRRELTVVMPLTPRFTIEPSGSVFTNTDVNFDATSTAGSRPLRFRWSIKGPRNDQVDTGTRERLTYRFTQPGSYAIALTVTDDDGATRTTEPKTVEVTVDCVPRVEFGITVVTPGEGVCLKPFGTKRDRYRSDGDIRLNGLVIDVPEGGYVKIFPPDESSERGSLASPSARVRVDGVLVFDGRMDWRLPQGDDPDEEGAIGGIGGAIPDIEVLQLPVVGGIEWSLGIDGKDVPFTRFHADVKLAGFNVTADLNLRVDERGTHKEGVYVQVENAKITDNIEVQNLCLSYIAPGVDDDAQDSCPAFEDFTGKPFLECGRDKDTERWDGTAEASLPLGIVKGLKASGGLSDGRLSYLAVSAEFDRPRIALWGGISRLSQMSAGFCLGSPFTIAGGAEISAVPLGPDDELIKANGKFTFKDSHTKDGVRKPWSAEILGDVRVAGFKGGNAYFGIDGDLTAKAGFGVDWRFPTEGGELASLAGGVDGWVNLKSGRFAVIGHARVCAVTIICAGAEALVSSTGAAGCVTIIDAISFGALGSTPAVRGGFGYSWGGGVAVMFPSCSIERWVPSPRARAARQAPTAPVTERVGECRPVGTPPGTEPVGVGDAAVSAAAPKTLELNDECVKTLVLRGGGGGAPDVRVTGPNGEVVETGPMTPAAGSFGAAPDVAVEPNGEVREIGPQGDPKHVLVVKDAVKGVTVVQLIMAPQGDWTIEPTNMSTITAVDRLQVEQPPAVTASVRGRGTARTLRYRYTPKPGMSLSFAEVGAADERGEQVGAAGTTVCDPSRPDVCVEGLRPNAGQGEDVQRPIGNLADGRRCGDGFRCIDFSPAYGPEGPRRIVMLATRCMDTTSTRCGSDAPGCASENRPGRCEGAPIDQQEVASYTAPRSRPPAQVRGVGIARGGGGLRVGFRPVREADHYEITTQERIFGRPGARAVDPESSACGVLPAVPRRGRLRVSVTPVNAFGDRGRTAVRTLKPGKRQLGRARPGGRSGSRRGDRLRGNGDANVLRGRGGNDRLDGRDGADCMAGDGGRDTLRGGDGADRLGGGAGDDVIVGGDGNDEITGGGGGNRIDAGYGADDIDVRNRKRDVVVCGAADDDDIDTVRADRIDVLRNCERRNPAGGRLVG